MFSKILLRTSRRTQTQASEAQGPAWGSPEVTEVLLGQAAAHLLEGLQPGSGLLQAGESRPGEPAQGGTFTASSPRDAPTSPGCLHPIIIEVKGHQGLWQLSQIGLEGT